MLNPLYKAAVFNRLLSVEPLWLNVNVSRNTSEVKVYFFGCKNER
jgi:hypothetical protein